MNLTNKVSLILIAVFAVFILTSCAKLGEDDTAIPWSRPADWEGRVPGMGGSKGI
ncbi:MAG: hypothetical protein DF168_01715 [Candidatus Moanabacter tarae]|uniref:Lipoprotein n=1 Tax=Candidatus Moanibacter tarae TaxID=2200854 RepID=A0A2Z4AEC6_9BACT|nr:MAG: hypothetical protein DF168_01715 [Candidatus Moanabacter tarae]